MVIKFIFKEEIRKKRFFLNKLISCNCKKVNKKQNDRRASRIAFRSLKLPLRRLKR